jgi:hypothetical protein
MKVKKNRSEKYCRNSTRTRRKLQLQIPFIKLAQKLNIEPYEKLFNMDFYFLFPTLFSANRLRVIRPNYAFGVFEEISCEHFPSDWLDD